MRRASQTIIAHYSERRFAAVIRDECLAIPPLPALYSRVKDEADKTNTSVSRGNKTTTILIHSH